MSTKFSTGQKFGQYRLNVALVVNSNLFLMPCKLNPEVKNLLQIYKTSDLFMSKTSRGLYQKYKTINSFFFLHISYCEN